VINQVDEETKKEEEKRSVREKMREKKINVRE